MAPKRKAAAKTEASPEPKKTKGGLAIGEDFPDLGALETEESTDGQKKTVDLKEVLKEQGIIVFIYPKANTPGCTTQACGLRDNYEALSAGGYQVFGLSADKPKAQLNWKAKYNLPYHLLSDPSFEALKKLGVTKGPKSVNRSHFIVDKGGKVVAAEYGISPKDSIAKVAAHVAAASGKPGAKDAVMKDASAEAAAETAAPEATDAAGAAAVVVKLVPDEAAESVALQIEVTP